MQQLPSNYAGEMPMRDIYRVAPGSWVFDPDCPCVGYRLLYPDWLAPRQEIGAIWFQLGKNGSNSTLTARSTYVWVGMSLK